MIAKFLAVIIVAMALVIVWGKFQIQGLEKELQAAVIKQEAAEATARSLESEKQVVESQLENFQRKVVEIEAEREEARKQVRYMRDIFQDHDFAKLIAAKPGLIENRMVKKTAEVLQELENVTRH